ncbi:hypothetical protein RJ639_022228 [Escallonia herrerae]|uniref:peptidylprolyl isomerase n=1 Tax=Escallonia herrerae TaxID=1293975 RepID=A0AA89AGU9_9ASTE|nr:hypothetical protein RJ639_022228 [Escallonia herrerae]
MESAVSSAVFLGSNPKAPLELFIVGVYNEVLRNYASSLMALAIMALSHSGKRLVRSKVFETSAKHFAIQAVSAGAKPGQFFLQVLNALNILSNTVNGCLWDDTPPKLGVKDSEVSSSQFKGFSVSTSTKKGDELKMGIEVSGGKTEEIFDLVFSNMVSDAQPIPGFRRTKGGKTPDIPRDILLQVLGPSKVYREVIKKVINSTIAEYIKREGLKVSKDLRVEQSFEDLESEFEPGDAFRFDATVQLLELN